jgi:hypothetical protein
MDIEFMAARPLTLARRHHRNVGNYRRTSSAAGTAPTTN